MPASKTAPTPRRRTCCSLPVESSYNSHRLTGELVTMGDTDNDLLTASAVSIASKVPQLTIRRWAREGLLTYRRDSAGRRLFRHAAIEEAKKLRERKTHTLRPE
jgi:MerR HTH family regulatory protein